MARARRPGGFWFHTAFGGQCGRRGIVGISKIYTIPFTRLNEIAFYLYIFWCKEIGLEGSNQLLEFLGSL